MAHYGNAIAHHGVRFSAHAAERFRQRYGLPLTPALRDAIGAIIGGAGAEATAKLFYRTRGKHKWAIRLDIGDGLDWIAPVVDTRTKTVVTFLDRTQLEHDACLDRGMLRLLRRYPVGVKGACPPRYDPRFPSAYCNPTMN